MSDYQFTHDWFSQNIPIWEAIKPHIPADPGRVFVEIGSFEGRSMVWIAENLLRSGDLLVCIDTWQGGEEHSAEDMAAVEARFDANRSHACSKLDNLTIFKFKGTSLDGLTNELRNRGSTESRPVDFVYIDGSHQAKDVMLDACLAWQLLAEGGVMVFDDYHWGEPRDVLHRPKLAIDMFTTLYAEEIAPLHVGYQYIIQKRRTQKATT